MGNTHTLINKTHAHVETKWSIFFVKASDGYTAFTTLFHPDASFAMAPRVLHLRNPSTLDAPPVLRSKSGTLPARWFWGPNHPNRPSPLGRHMLFSMSTHAQPLPSFWRLRPAWLDRRFLHSSMCTLALQCTKLITLPDSSGLSVQAYLCPSFTTLGPLVWTLHLTFTASVDDHVASCVCISLAKRQQINKTSSITHHPRVSTIVPTFK